MKRRRTLRDATLALVLAALIMSHDAQGIPSVPVPSGAYCIAAADGKSFRLLVLRPTGGLGLDFGLSISTAEGTHCGVTGRAMRSAVGWNFEIGSPSSSDYCAVTITSINGNLQLSAAPVACESVCGAHAGMENLMFPASSKVRDSVPAEMIKPKKLFNADCNSLKWWPPGR